MEENKKERYEAPEVLVVELKTRAQILQASQDNYPGYEI